jgi:hypothetical protein
MIYTDGIHLITDGEIFELHIFAQKIGLKKEWFQDKKWKHYDIWNNKLKKAIQNGAIKISSKEIIKILQKLI